MTRNCPSFRAKARSAAVEESPSSWPNGSLIGTAAIPRLAALARNDNLAPVIPSEGAKRRSRGIAVVLAEWLSIGTAAIPRLAALARNDTSPVIPSEGAKRRVEESPSSWPNGSLSGRLRFLDSLRSLGMTTSPSFRAKARSAESRNRRRPGRMALYRDGCEGVVLRLENSVGSIAMAARTPKKKVAAKTTAKKKSSAKSAPDPLGRLRQICLALPEAHEVEAWGEPTFRVRNKLFAMHSSAGTHHGARTSRRVDRVDARYAGHGAARATGSLLLASATLDQAGGSARGSTRVRCGVRSPSCCAMRIGSRRQRSCADTLED